MVLDVLQQDIQMLAKVRPCLVASLANEGDAEGSLDDTREGVLEVLG